MSSFRLTKWYLDCVSERGDFIIGYAAILQLGILKFPLVGQLRRIDGQIESSTSLTRGNLQPQQESGKLTWDCPKLNIHGAWRPLSAPVKRELLRNSEGGVVWECLQPSADATVKSSGSEIRGLGYAERMEMTLAPWKLGIRALQWGRFVSASDSVVWIVWDGEREFTMILHNGVEAPQGQVGQNAITLNQDSKLLLDDTQVIRTGSINDTALSSIPLVRAALPRWLRRIDEQKWLSRGQLMHTDRILSQGWVIHERVSFEQ